MVRSCHSARLAPVLLAFLVLLSAGARVSTQSELVIHKKGTKLYHRAGCPVVRDGKDVVALTRAQAESRGLAAHDACDPSKTSAPAGSNDPEQRFVYIDGSKYYHRAKCPKMEKDAKRVELEHAGKKYWPCPRCRPPVRKMNPEPAIPK